MTKVLTVDDSSSMRQMVCFTLKNAGYDVAEAADGVEALEIAKTNEFDLILSDVNMPNMNGISLVTELRKLKEYKFVPILMLTTESSTEKKQQGRSAGATGWIVKPFEPQKLLATLNRVID